MEWAIRRQEPPREGSEVRRRCPMKPRPALGRCSALSGRRERTDRNVISVRISERELLGLSVRIHVWLLFEPADERACPLKRQVGLNELDDRTGFESDALGSAIWKGCERYMTSLLLKTMKYLSPARPARGNPPGQSPRCRLHYTSQMDNFWLATTRPMTSAMQVGHPKMRHTDFGKTILDTELTEMMIQMFVH